ncbi:hypothetical protein BABINDRAFT_160793 [Babjeviella inositovora NRRL Y-12698]|uniref:Spt20-like SEP domain-containing protein n=1 Tax=Babjeviella inositovora NRRL Y-12698 TaxID=984486 RepID=A0A1E3QSA4_9ASCO|nr:uncharacterized protein BABINDRAFT_160793 [Babjeviella inositovora NRRL Y-12698]ODQ80518.1 hypothetical protein BABINDRAFT_160793 [Babjeviella inositovora NRRL Y-12698]
MFTIPQNRSFEDASAAKTVPLTVKATTAALQLLVSQTPHPQPVPVKPRRHYKFAETNEEILKKYEHLPPSLEFHIHENHYRFSTQEGGNIPKSSPTVKKFMENVLNEEIPPELVEVLRDGGIQLYEGCIILQIADYRELSGKLNMQAQPEPKTYRTLLRPTQLSLYFDLLYHTDFSITRFSDQLSLNLESEILTLTKRNIDLSVPLNPYNYEHLKPDVAPPQLVTDPVSGQKRLIHPHREEKVPFTTLKPPGVFHDKDIQQRSSEYEDLMLIMTNDQLTNAATGQFARLRYIEQIRRKMKLAQQQAANAATVHDEPDHNLSISTASVVSLKSSMSKEKPKQTAKEKKEAKAAAARKPVSGKTLPGHYASKTVPGGMASTADGTPTEPPAKKKRGTYKKKPKGEAKDGKETPKKASKTTKKSEAKQE